MKRMKFLSLLFLLFAVTQAQITITQADFESQLAVGNTLTTFADTLTATVDIGNAGQGTWDFSGQQSQFQIDATSIDPATSPAAGSFSGANYVTYSMPTFAGVTSESWVHISIDGNSYKNLGVYTTATTSGFTTNTTIVIDPAETLYQLPLTYNATWTESGTRVVNTEVAGFPGQSYDVDYTITNTVDAYGALTMPDGTTENVLRIKTETELVSNVGGVPSTSNYVDYTFLSRSGSFVSVSVAGTAKSLAGSVPAEEISWGYGTGSPSNVEQLEKLANDFSLAQNYPNPFNPTTNIQYSIPVSSHVSLKVYDVLGNEVASLVNDELSAGVYKSRFDGANLSSGIYFYTLRADNFTATKKLMLVK